MKRFVICCFVPFFFLLVVSCSTQPTPEAETSVPVTTGAPITVEAEETLPTQITNTNPPASPSATSAPEIKQKVTPDETSLAEPILILEPGPGSRLTSPLRVAGIADPTFEQTLVVRLLLDDGTELAIVPAQIQADLGQRGPFSVDIPFLVEGDRSAFIQVYAESTRDGGITHLASVGVLIADSGQKEVIPVEPHSERIIIFQPELGTRLQGGVAHVEGFALASFEGTLVIEVVDENGNVVGQQPTIVSAPEMGVPGPFSVDVPYGNASGPGRIVVRDPSPAFGGDVHLSSVEVNLEP